MKKPVSLQDIAVRAGVHATTVSMALRDSSRISAAMREKIRQLAEEMGYRPNPLVTALMHQRRSGRELILKATLAWVTSFPTRHGWKNSDMNDAFRAAVARAHRHGFGLDVQWAMEPGMTPARFRQILMARGITGVIVSRLPPGVRTLDIDVTGMAAVGFGVTLQKPELHRVAYNHFDVVEHAVAECCRRGYRRPGLALVGGYEPVDESRCGAYLVSAHRWPDLNLIPVYRHDQEDAAHFLAWRRRYRPDVIITPAAGWAMKTLLAEQIVPPKDIGLLSLDNTDTSSTFSGFFQGYDLLATAAVDLLVGLLYRNERGAPSQPQKALILGSWMEGTTLRSA